MGRERGSRLSGGIGVVTIYESESRDTLIEQFERLGLPYDEIHEIQFSQSFGEMEGMLKQMGKI